MRLFKLRHRDVTNLRRQQLKISEQPLYFQLGEGGPGARGSEVGDWRGGVLYNLGPAVYIKIVSW